jgi:raffinose synthase
MPMNLLGSSLVEGERLLLAEVDPGLSVEPDPTGAGVFLRAEARRSASRLLFQAGKVPALRRYTACHRYEPYWMKPAAGTRLSDVPAETQFLLAELVAGGWLLLVPLLEEPFRFSLRGHSEGGLELLAETGDPHLGGSGGLALFIALGEEPFELCEAGARAVSARLGSACRLRREKPLPDFVDQFGWCTWDAFYQEVSAEKLRTGLTTFQAAGVPPRFVILDDGWQSVRYLPTGERRLTSFHANDKFAHDLSPCIREAKQEFGVQTFLVWHALNGYWGGVDPEGLPGYSVVEQPRRFGEGILSHMPRCNEEWWGGLVGLVSEAGVERFFDDYHRSLAAQGVDGVKVDNQAVLESLGAQQGGRVRLTRAYRRALEESVQLHFAGRLINCMANAQETYYGSPRSTLTRTSIDFFPRRPETHSAHLYANAHVGLWFGCFMQPDWDMFQSGHEWGAFHAAGRALSGGPVYVSDKPGEHDARLLRRLVCSDGSVLRADGPGLPTAKTLCSDPTRERVPLEIWNRSGRAGLIGVFHALYARGQAEPVSGVVRVEDVPGLAGDRFACYAVQGQQLSELDRTSSRSFSLGEREFEIFWLVPIEQGFAALGLADKLNGPAALRAVEWSGPDTCQIALADGGELLAWSERAPRSVEAGGRALAFRYEPQLRALRVAVSPAEAPQITLHW